MDFQPSERAAQTAQRVWSFIDTRIAPSRLEHWSGILKRRQVAIGPMADRPASRPSRPRPAQEACGTSSCRCRTGRGPERLDYAFSAEQTGRSMMAPRRSSTATRPTPATSR